MLKLIRAALSAILLASLAAQPVAAQLLTYRVATLSKPAAKLALPFLASINTVGWNAEPGSGLTLPSYSTGATEFAPDTAPLVTTFNCAGLTSTGAATTYPVTRVISRRVRQAWTGVDDTGYGTHLLGAATGTVALSDYVYQGCTATGVANNSTAVSPQVIAQWQLRSRRVVGNTLHLEFVAFHRDGIVGATCSATNGTKTTFVANASALTTLSSTTDKHAVLGYTCDIDTSQYADATAIADGTTLTANAAIYPKLGVTASILDTSTGGLSADARGFSPQTFVKNAAKVADPPVAFVGTGGTDETVNAAGTGTTSAVTKIYGGGGTTPPACASANKFATIPLALQAFKLATTRTGTGGFNDGSIVRLCAGTYTAPANTTAQTYQTAGEVIVEGDPSDTIANVSLDAGSSMRQSWLTYRHLTLVRQTSTALTLLTGGRLSLENVAFSNGTQTTAFFAVITTMNGVTITGTIGPLTNGSFPLLLARGVDYGTLNTATGQIDTCNVTGSGLRGTAFVSGGRAIDGCIVAFNTDMGWRGTQGPVGFTGPSSSTTGFAFVQNLIENTSSSAFPLVYASNDPPQAYSVIHLIEWFNTYTGVGVAGRHNGGYDNTFGALRTNRLWSQVGDIYVAYFNKHDWEFGSTATLICGGSAAACRAEAPSHTGSWPTLYQVGSRGLLFQNTVDSGPAINGTRSLAWLGLNGAIGSGPTTPTRLDPLFTAEAAVTSTNGTTFTQGAGGGTYTLQSGSPAKSRVANCPFAGLPDLAGATRGSTCSAGAFE